MRAFSFPALVLALSCAVAQDGAPPPPQASEDPIDAESTRLLREYTTDPSFLTEWVDHVPESDAVPSPRDHLGYVIGTPKKLTKPEKINEYFRTLASKSNRVQVFSMGKSHGGREMIVAAIADPDLLDQLDQIKAANRELADPRKTTEARAREIARSTPPIYWMTAGLHSPETGPPEMVMELAYRLAVSERDHIRKIRARVVTLISPVLEMDGRARMVDHYYRNLQKVTDYEDKPPRMAPYWGDYTAHDNNRDGLQQSQPLTRNYTDTYFDFLPVLSLDLHESVPLLYVSMGTGPYNDTVDPITVSEWHWISGYEVSEATKLGLQGVWTWGFYTGWYPGYLLWVTNNHNACGRFYETFGNSHPGTFTRKLKNSKYAGKRLNTRQWYRPWPPDREVLWSLRNNTNYMQTGVLASLQLVADNGEKLLFNYWQKGSNSLKHGRTEAPHAFVIPADQRDKRNLRHLLWLLARQRIEVHRMTISNDFGLEGDLVVRMDQPYRNFAKTLLSKQNFPKSADLAPYDDVAWSYDYMLGVEVKPIDSKEIFQSPMELVKEAPALTGSVQDGSKWVIDHKAQTALASFAWGLKGAKLRALAKEWNGHPAGSLVIEGVDAAELKKLCDAHLLDAVDISGESPGTIEVDLPRVAMFHTWTYTQDSGWVRYALEQLGIPYTTINKDHLRAGGLRGKFDVILVPTQGRRSSFKNIVQGIDPKWGPMPYTRTEEFSSHGVIDSTEDMTGGMGFEGLSNLEKFVQEGGLLITLGAAGVLPADGGIARGVNTSKPQGLLNPGSHVTTKVLRPEHPVVWGYPEIDYVFRGNYPLFTVSENDQGRCLMQYGVKTRAEAEREADKKADIPVKEKGKDGQEGEERKKKKPLLLSGMIRGGDKLERMPAILDVPTGNGRVLLYSWNPMHRYQNHHDFPFVTNALLFWNDFPGTPTEEEMLKREAE